MAKTKKQTKRQEVSHEKLPAQAIVPEDEQPYEVPKNWVWVKFFALAKDMADGPFGSNLKTEHYTTKKEARIIQLSNIGEEGWREDNTRYTTFEHTKTISRSIVKPGEIVIAKMMPAGRAIIVPSHEEMFVLSSDAIKMVPHKTIVARYLVYGINSIFFKNQVQGNTQGITRARTSIGKLKTYAFPLPPLAEQHRIVCRIESLFEKLDRAKALVQPISGMTNVAGKIDHMKKAILARAFRGELGTNDPREERAVELLNQG